MSKEKDKIENFWDKTNGIRYIHFTANKASTFKTHLRSKERDNKNSIEFIHSS